MFLSCIRMPRTFRCRHSKMCHWSCPAAIEMPPGIRTLHIRTSSPYYSYSEVTDVHLARPDPSDHASRHHPARRYRRVPVLAARPDAVRGGPVMRFVRNNQHHVLFHWLTFTGSTASASWHESARPKGEHSNDHVRFPRACGKGRLVSDGHALSPLEDIDP